MKTGKISIVNGTVNLTTVAGDVWLTQHEIADLFACFVSKVGSNIRSILKSGVIDETKVYRMIRSSSGNYIELYNLEMITALAFRIRSENADIFRRWLIKGLAQGRNITTIHISVQQTGTYFPN